MRLRSAVALIAFILIALAVGVLGSLATQGNVDGWYAEAAKAPWSPPNWIFAPVWILLYSLMGIAAWLVWRERDARPVRPALRIYIVQLVLNALWTPVFFGLYPFIGSAALWIALGIILALDLLVLVTMVAFWRVRRLSAWLLVPYWAWLLFATTLNAAVAILNT